LAFADANANVSCSETLGEITFGKKIDKYIQRLYIQYGENDMANSTVNISFQDDLLESIDTIAKEEARSRSELIREAARLYIEKKTRWKSIFSYGEKIKDNNKIEETDIYNEIKKNRTKK
jgi:CopG family transcriptional regulator / antitoxin EndoAI